MKKNILIIALAMVIVAIFYAITFTGAVYLCEASGRELTDNNIQWAALIVFAIECMFTTISVCVWATYSK